MLPGHPDNRADRHTPASPGVSRVFGIPAGPAGAGARLEGLTEQWVARLTARTGQPREVCAAWLSRPDVEFTVEAALDHGLIDEILG